VFTGLCDHRLERSGEAIGWQRRRPMIVDHATSRGFEGAGERRDRFDNVNVDERLQFRRLVLLEEADDQKKQLRLALTQIAHGVDERSHVPLLLPNGHGRRMLAGSGEVRAIARTRYLHEALGPAAHGANLPTERGAAASCTPSYTQGTYHARSIV
jgi:hypothetical protein